MTRITILYIDEECRNKNCLKGKGGNALQHKKGKETEY